MVEPRTTGPPRGTGSRSPGTGCIRHASLFQDPLVEEPPRTSAPASIRRRYRMLAEQAAQVCDDCPLQERCLYSAVVDHDVAGIAAGTTQRERAAIRRELNIIVEPEDFDALAGVSGSNQPVNHDEVVRLHRLNQHEPLDALAERLGCSLSTVKRHLRYERERGDDVESPSSHRVAGTKKNRPSVAQVMAVVDKISARAMPERRAA